MNYRINTLEELKNFAFKIPEEGMQTHYVPGFPNKIIKPASSFEKRVFIKGSPLVFIDEEGIENLEVYKKNFDIVLTEKNNFYDIEKYII